MSVNFINDRWNIQFIVNSERYIFESLLMAILFIYSQSFSQKSSERKSQKKYFFSHFIWKRTTNHGLTANKPTDYLLDFGDHLQSLQFRCHFQEIRRNYTPWSKSAPNICTLWLHLFFMDSNMVLPSSQFDNFVYSQIHSDGNKLHWRSWLIFSKTWHRLRQLNE